jgi:hypothetical protein
MHSSQIAIQAAYSHFPIVPLSTLQLPISQLEGRRTSCLSIVCVAIETTVRRKWIRWGPQKFSPTIPTSVKLGYTNLTWFSPTSEPHFKRRELFKQDIDAGSSCWGRTSVVPDWPNPRCFSSSGIYYRMSFLLGGEHEFVSVQFDCRPLCICLYILFSRLYWKNERLW